jgi:polysaccharide chain length determinant protein (PEP-CTERM system associated)
MVKNGEITLTEAKRILRHYWWILPLTVIGCGVLGLLAAIVLPKRYTSQTLVLVDQPTVSADIVKPVVTEDLNQRLASMQGQILGRTRLQPIIEKFGLYAEDRKQISMEELVDRLRKSVTVKPLEPMAGTQNRSLPGFYVSVTFDNAQTAQQICTQITSMFMEQNTREREQKASQTTSFLNAQLEEAKRKLDEQDAKLAQFKQQNLGSLPEEAQTNLSLLAGMNAQLAANTEALSRAQQDKALNETLLSQQEATWNASRMGTNFETADQQLNSLQDELAKLLARYTPEHPDVVKLKTQIAELKKHIAEASKANDQGSGTNQASAIVPPPIQQLRAKLRQDELNINDLTKRQGQIQEQIRKLEARVQASPMVEQQFKEITRNHQTALDFYNQLLKQRDQAAMASDLEHQQESEQFRVLDPPSLPDKPSFPKKLYFAGGGLGGGFALGLGIMYVIALTDKSMHTERDVELCLKLPVLAMVPMLELAEGRESGMLRAGSSYGEKTGSRT